MILVSHDQRALPFADRAIRIGTDGLPSSGGPDFRLSSSCPTAAAGSVPEVLLPEWTPMPGLVARRQDGGLFLQPPREAGRSCKPGNGARDRPPATSGSAPVSPLTAQSARNIGSASSAIPDRTIAHLDRVSAGFGGRTLFAHLDLELRAGSGQR